jgi:hypothetical protein
VNVKAVAFCALVMMATPATAQTLWGPYGAYAPGPIEIHAMYARLRANGLRPITQPVYSGRYVVMRAVDPYGSVVRVLFNAHYGNIVSLAPLPPAAVAGYRPYAPYAARRYDVQPHTGEVRPDLKSEPEGYSHHAAPYPAVPEQRTAAVTPPRTPMPRPRPAIKPTPEAPVAASPVPEVAQAPNAVQAPAATPPVVQPEPAPETTGSVATRKAPEPFPPAALLE